jgi:hypothetical protein
LNEVRNENHILALAVAASLAPAIAQVPKLPDDNAWPGISQRSIRCSQQPRAACEGPSSTMAGSPNAARTGVGYKPKSKGSAATPASRSAG